MGGNAVSHDAAHESTQTILTVESLNVVHHRRGGADRGAKFWAVKDASLHVRKGEVVGLVGESGSGKTSLALAVCALGRVTSGTIDVAGLDLGSLRGKRQRMARADVQMVFQDPHASLDPRQKIGKGLDELRRLHPDRDIEPSNEALLARVGLAPQILDRLPHQVSGGQAQRISITRATMLRPKLLVADEPTSGLDASVQAQILDLFQSFRTNEHLSMLFVSHNLAVVRQLCDRAYVMRHGEIVEHGDTATLFDDPQHEYTRQLIDAVPGKNIKLAGVQR